MRRPHPNAPASMRAMQLERPGEVLRAVHVAVSHPDPGQVLLRVEACCVCRTDLHLIDGELPGPVLPMISGHEFLALAPKVPVRTEVLRFALEEVNDTLEHLRRGALQGATALLP